MTPSLEIDLAPATGLIPIASDGKMVWAVGDHTLLRIDAETNTVERLDAPVESDDTTLSLADDGLWATRWAGGRLYRLDPQTGETILDVVMPKAVRVAFMGDEMWVGREDQDSMSVVDRETGDVGSASVEAGAYGFAGMGDLWFTPGLESQVVRVDPATGNIKATIPVTGESNCQIGGTFPDNAWTSCFGREVIERSVTRVDPTTNEAAVVATLPPTHGGSVIAINGQPWFIGSFEDAAGDLFAGLLRINPETGAIEQFFSIPGADPDPSVVAGDALWVPDEARHKLLRIELSDLDAG